MHAGMRRMFLFTAISITLAALGGAAFAQAVGTWKLNLTKSKYHQGQMPKSATLVYEAAGAGIKVTVDQVPASGAAIHYAYTANYDGKDVSVVGNPNADAAARTRVNATTTKLVNKKGGNILSEATLVLSADGKTLTITTTGKDPKGQNIDSVAVYEKQ
jgi:ABC-type glycerol-3-phosphate transport system substrate-binding protein